MWRSAIKAARPGQGERMRLKSAKPAHAYRAGRLRAANAAAFPTFQRHGALRSVGRNPTLRRATGRALPQKPDRGSACRRCGRARAASGRSALTTPAHARSHHVRPGAAAPPSRRMPEDSRWHGRALAPGKGFGSAEPNASASATLNPLAVCTSESKPRRVRFARVSRPPGCRRLATGSDPAGSAPEQAPVVFGLAPKLGRQPNRLRQ